MANTNDRMIYQIPFFDGGVHTKSSSHIIGDNESPSALNVDTEDNGSVRTRYGSTALTHQTLGTGTWYGLTTFQPMNANSQLVGWYGSAMVRYSGGTFVTIPSSEGVFTQATNVVYDSYDGYLFMSDGGTPYKYNGTEFTRHGIEVPSAALVTTAATAGANTGIYMYKFAFVNSMSVGGDVGSAVTINFGATSSIASITGIPTAPISYGINARYVYRTKTGGSVYYYLATISDNTTTTYKDEALDTTLTELAPTDQGKPPNYIKIRAHKERLFLVDSTDPATVQYSEIGNPYVVKVLNFEDIGLGVGKIKMLAVSSDGVIVGKNNSETWLLYLADNDPTNWQVLKSNSAYGSNCGFNINYEDKVFFLGCIGDSPMGFVTLKGLSLVNEPVRTDISATITDLLSFRIEDQINDIARTYLDKITGVHFNNKIYVTFTDANATANNKMFVYDYQRRNESRDIGSWVPWSGLSIGHLAIYDNKLYGTTSGEGVGKVLQLDKEGLFSDSGVAINSYYETKFFGGSKNEEQHTKDFRWLYLWVTLLGSWSMNVHKITDFVSGDGEISTIDLTNAATALWDSALWDVGVWSDSLTEKEFAIDLGKLQSRRIKFKFTNQNTAGQAFKVNRATFEYILRTRRRFNG